jgi:hypothetical protein
MGPRGGLKAVEKKEMSCSCRESKPLLLDRPARTMTEMITTITKAEGHVFC